MPILSFSHYYPPEVKARPSSIWPGQQVFDFGCGWGGMAPLIMWLMEKALSATVSGLPIIGHAHILVTVSAA